MPTASVLTLDSHKLPIILKTGLWGAGTFKKILLILMPVVEYIVVLTKDDVVVAFKLIPKKHHRTVKGRFGDIPPHRVEWFRNPTTLILATYLYLALLILKLHFPQLSINGSGWFCNIGKCLVILSICLKQSTKMPKLNIPIMGLRIL